MRPGIDFFGRQIIRGLYNGKEMLMTTVPPKESFTMTPNVMRALNRLKQSKFRSKFRLAHKDKEYIDTKGLEIIRQHGMDFVAKRIAPAKPAKDGKQTPWKGHPVFVAQHATATCCRKCIAKWHGIPKGRELRDLEIEYLVNLIMSWIVNELKTDAELFE